MNGEGLPSLSPYLHNCHLIIAVYNKELYGNMEMVSGFSFIVFCFSDEWMCFFLMFMAMRHYEKTFDSWESFFMRNIIQIKQGEAKVTDNKIIIFVSIKLVDLFLL